VVWLCHPNNPTGGAARIGQIEELTVHLPGALFVIDEAYIPFAPDLASAATLVQTGRVVVLRSMTKHAGLAGLRLGYAIASERVATVLRRALPPWSVNSLAQVAGMLALSDPAHDEAVRRAVRRSMSHLEGGLRSLGLCPLPTETNFVLVPVADGAALTGWLHERRIAVRDCASFGLAEYVRIGVRCIPDQERLLTVLGQWVRGHAPEGLTLAAVR
jgi:histidinol-phosphate aminotransferase